MTTCTCLSITPCQHNYGLLSKSLPEIPAWICNMQTSNVCMDSQMFKSYLIITSCISACENDSSRNYFYNEMDSCTIRHYFQDASTSWMKTATQLHLQHDIAVFITQSPQQIIVLTTIRRSCMVGDFIFSTRLNGPHLYGTLWHLFPSLAFSWACQCNHNESTWSWHHSSLKHSTHFKSTNFCCTTICPTHSCHYTTVFWSSV